MMRISVDRNLVNECLDKNGEVCTKCAEVCKTGALKVVPHETRRKCVAILNDPCNGCGDCIDACPYNAIEIYDSKRQRVYVLCYYFSSQSDEFENVGVYTSLKRAKREMRNQDSCFGYVIEEYDLDGIFIDKYDFTNYHEGIE